MNMDYETYLSPFSWRYGSQAMRQIWSEVNKRRLWRKLWVALAEAQSDFGAVRPELVADLRAHADEINVPRALEIEAEIHHDLMAELRVFAEQALLGEVYYIWGQPRWISRTMRTCCVLVNRWNWC